MPYDPSRIITTEEALDELVQHYLDKPEWVFDVETIGKHRKDPHRASLCWISLACDDRVDVIPMGHPHGEMIEDRMALRKSGQAKIAAGKTRDQLKDYDFSTTEHDPLWAPAPKQLPRHRVIDMMEPLFFGGGMKIGHNLKYDLHTMAKYYGEAPVGPYYDTMVASWAIDVSRKGFLDLASCYERETGGTLVKGVGSDISQHSFKTVAAYSYLDAEATWELYQALRRRIAKEPNLERLVRLEMEVMEPSVEMESTGVRLDLVELAEIRDRLTEARDMLEGQIYAAAGRKFNINSIPQRQDLLFGSKDEGGFGMRPLKPTPKAKDVPEEDRTPRHWSADNETLEKLAERRGKGAALARMLIDHTAKVKLLGTYVTPYLDPALARENLLDGRVHGTFKQSGTETGRFSSSNPNLQNIPSRKPDGKRLRYAFVPDEGCIMIAADYSQIEPRIIASLSGDPTLIETYRDGGDVYQTVADRMGVVRATGKELVLSIAYGVGPQTISARTGFAVADAKDLMDYFDRQFPAINRHKSRVIARARAERCSYTVMGRRRPLPQFGWSSYDAKSKAERQAYNHLIQGCLPADAQVLTRDRGWLPIGDFIDGTEVWTGENWAPAVRVFRGDDTRLRLHLSDGRTFDCDTRHKLLVHDAVWPRWASMDEIVGLPLVEDRAEEWGRQQDHPDDWYWLGRMIGDGSTSKPDAVNRMWSLAFGPDEDEDRQRFLVWLDKHVDDFKGGSNSRTGYTVSPSQVQGQTLKGWSYWVDRGVVGGSRGKRIPQAVFQQDRQRRESFFQGYFDADGSEKTRASKITSVNLDLLRDTLRLMQTIGRHGRISRPMLNSSGVEWYDLYIHTTPTVLTVERVEELPQEPMYTLSVDDPRHAFSSEGLISKNTAADIMKIALVNIYHALPEEARMLMTVHDEVVVQAPHELEAQTIQCLKAEMEGVRMPRIVVPLVAEIKSGSSWGECK